MRNQNGFTLIELVVVIVILGVLAAVAVPRFVDLQGEARRSTLQGMQGALNSAAALARAQQLAQNVASNGSITVEGSVSVGLTNGYPQANAGGIGAMIQEDGFNQVAGGSGWQFQLEASPTPTSCYTEYRASTGGFPAVVIDSSGCN